MGRGRVRRRGGRPGPAVRADAQSGGGTGEGVYARSNSGPAGDFESTSGIGVKAKSNPAAAGLDAQSSSGPAVNASSGSGPGSTAYSTSGVSALFDGTSNTRWTTLGSNPASTLAGDLWHRTSMGWLSKIAKNGGAAAIRHLFDTGGGMAFAADYEAGPDDISAQTVVVSAVLTGNNAPVATGTVLVVGVVEVGRMTGTTEVNARLFDSTASVPIIDEDYVLGAATGAGIFTRHTVLVAPYTLPASGNRTFHIDLEATNGGDDVNWRTAALFVLGVF